MKIRIYLDRPLYQTLQEYYEKAKQLKEKIKRLEKILEEKEKELNELQKEYQENTELLFKLLRVEASGWYRKFGWSFTSTGKLIIFGKSAQMNEILIKKYTEPSDWVFHADIVGAGFVVVKSPELKEPDIQEAARIAASFSKAWKHGIYSLDVFYVKASQVSKSVPSGEYIKKGAFMIYGERNWVKHVEVKICFGINLSVPSFFVAGSEEACKLYTDHYWVLIPASGEKEKDLKRLIQQLRELTGLSKQSLRKYLDKYLPGKNIKVVAKGKGLGRSFPR